MEKITDEMSLFNSLCDGKELSMAVDVLRRAADKSSTVADHIKLGFGYSRIGMFEEAESILTLVWRHLPAWEQSAIAVVSELATVKYHLGKFDDGAALEKLVMDGDRFQNLSSFPPDLRDAFRQVLREKLIADEQSLAGKSVFVLWVGGNGDCIEHSRNIERIVAEGACAVFADPAEPLRELFSNSTLPFFLQPATVENLARCDAIAFANMLSWRYYHSELSTLPRPGYMRAARERPVNVRISGPIGKRKVGIVWRSINGTRHSCRHEPFRSMDLSTLEPLLVSGEVQFYSLQYGEREDHERERLAHFGVVDVSPYIRTFADLADVMMQLDLVISIDSAPAHLAGALDIPVWNLLSRVADWRWGAAGNRTTPLYPSMRLFRQSMLGDWTPVVAELVSEIACVQQ